MSKFQFALNKYESRYGRLFKFNCALRRFKRRHFVSKKKQAAAKEALHKVLRESFKVEPAPYYPDQPH